MSDYPKPILDYIYEITIANRSLAYLLVGEDGCLIDSGGELDVYGIEDLEKGEIAAEKVYFLEGLLPLKDKSVFFSCVEVETGIYMDVHIFSDKKGYWVLLLNATPAAIQRCLIQQSKNELGLLQEKLSKILEQIPEK